MKRLDLSVLGGTLAICRLSPDTSLPDWLPEDGFLSVTRTADELSIVCLEDAVPELVTASRGWRALRVEGPLDFSLTGVMASLAAPLAEAEISLFAIATYDTDYVLVSEENLLRALDVLRAAGHRIG